MHQNSKLFLMPEVVDIVNIRDEERKSKGLTPVIPKSEIDARIKRCKKLMKEQGFDALLVYGSAFEPSWVRYLANLVHAFALAQSYLLVPIDHDPILLVDQKFYIPSAKEMTRLKDVRVYPYIEFPTQFDDNVRLFRDIFKELGLRSSTVGINTLDMPVTNYQALERALPDAKVKDCMDLMWKLIEDKSPYDQRMIRKTAKIADMKMETALEECEEGKPEYEVGLAAEKVAVANGAEFGNGATVRTHLYIASGSGVLANVRPYKYTAKKLKRGEMFFIDLSVCFNGYYTDFCRTVCVGKPSKKQKELFEFVEQTHYALFDKLKPGTTGAELWDLAYDMAKKKGYEDRINIWMGHGTGIVISEPPFLVKYDERPLRKGTFVNIEPGAFFPETIGSSSLEDATFVGAKRASWVTKCERGLHIA